MLTRLTHSAIAFAITAVVYQAYVLFAAPLIEPPPGEQSVQSTEGQQAQQLQPVHKFRELLAAYFPTDHWSLTKPPVTAENGQMMLVFDEFKPHDDGTIRVQKCAILFFPSGRVSGDPPPIDAVVLEAPQGAVLQLEESYRSGMTTLGRVQSGRLLGAITVRSDMRELGAHDDLLLTTRDVEIQADLIYTRARVQMQLGPHRGTGRHLEIRLVAVERSRARTQRSSVGNIDSLVVFHDVQASLLPSNAQLTSSQSATLQSAPPVEITCDGSFRFDFAKQIASFHDRVQLTQTHPLGLRDQLQCGTLSVYLASESNEVGPSSGQLQARSIAATSSDASPVLLDAESQQAHARCERIWIDLPSRQVTFDRNERVRSRAPVADVRPRIDVELRYGSNEIHAPFVKYKAPPTDARQRIGEFEAQGGGWFSALSSNKSDAQPIEVRWTEHMRLRRINGQPVLSLNGRPKLDVVGMGQLWADYLDLYLREKAWDGSEDQVLPGDVVPDRLVATGEIAIDSEQLHGKVKQLEVNFDYLASDLELTSPTGNGSGSGGNIDRQGGLKRAYDIQGQQLDMLVTVRQRKTEITSIDVDGNVLFSERPSLAASAAAANEQTLQVVANHLQISNADSPSAEIVLEGQPATISADGMLIRTANLQIHRGESNANVHAPGEIELLVDRDLSGQALPAPQPATIRWQRSMQLERDRITFSGNVQVQTVEGTLHTHHLVVRLTSPVRFDGASSRRRIDIAELSCHGGANAMFSQRDETGLTSVQTMKLEDSFFANLQTGKLRGEGPGQIESVHLSDAKSPFGNATSFGAPERLTSTQPPSTEQRLRFLGVQFVRGIEGNLHRRQVVLVGDVDAVYGPVDAWEQKLALTKRGMPGPDTLWINCQRLGVAESPLAKLQTHRSTGIGPIELQAEGNTTSGVTIEGPYGERGNFTTHSLLAKYDQLKNTFILEGNNQYPAKISVQEYRGGPVNTTPARKIIYSLESRDVKVEGLMPGQFRQLTPVR